MRGRMAQERRSQPSQTRRHIVVGLAEGETRVFIATQSLMDSKDAMTMSTIVDATVETTDPDTAPAAVTREHITTLKTGIQRSEEFEKKGLASYAVNVGTKCGHDCTYCSTGTMLRMHPSFKEAGEKPFDLGYAIVDPTMPDRVAIDAANIRPEKRGLVQLCTTTDAWAPEAQKHDLGRRCLEGILGQPGWSVRVLTKNAAVAKDY